MNLLVEKEPSVPLVLNNATVIDATGAAPRQHATVVVVGMRIASMGESGSVRVPDGAQAIDASGQFLVPGLWDMHVHLRSSGERGLALHVINGVTGVRDMMNDWATIQDWRRRIATGALLGPRILAAGPTVDSVEFLEGLTRIEQQAGFPPGILTSTRAGVGSEEDARRVVRTLAEMGVGYVKYHTASRDAYLALAAEARRIGLPLVGHNPASSGVSLSEASDAGQRSIEHLDSLAAGLDPMAPDERARLFERFAENGTVFVPTLIHETGRLMSPAEKAARIERPIDETLRPYALPRLLRSWRQQIDMQPLRPPMDWSPVILGGIACLRAMHEAGVQILPGTELGGLFVYPGLSLHDELVLLVNEVGLTPMQALQSATRDAATFLGLGESLGTIEEGKIADLVLLRADPLADISNTRRIAGVALNGNWLGESDIARMLTDADGDAARPERPDRAL